MPGTDSTDRDRPYAGIACMVGATMMFAVSNALAKFQAASYPVGEVMALRSLSSLLFCALLVLPGAGLSVFATRRVGAHLARGLSQSVSQTFTVIALKLMPLAGAVAIGFSSPLFAALVAVLVLKERADPWRVAALGLGFLGVLVIARPGTDAFQIGALFALANAAMYGSVTVAVRGMTRTESTLTLLMWQMAALAVFHSTLLTLGFVAPTRGDAALFLACGAANGLAQLAWTRALALAPATVVSPFYYLLLVWSLPIGYAIWGDAPTPSLLLGSAVVVASAVALLAREARLKRAAASPAGAREPAGLGMAAR